MHTNSKYLQPGEAIKIPRFVPGEDFEELRARYLMEIGEKRRAEIEKTYTIWVYGDNGWEDVGPRPDWDSKRFQGEFGMVAKCLPIGQKPEDPKKKKSLWQKLLPIGERP
jgi:hypothetical protein